MKPFVALLALGAVLTGLCCGLALDAKGIVERQGDTTVEHVGDRS
jgi:hypothetical protein